MNNFYSLVYREIDETLGLPIYDLISDLSSEFFNNELPDYSIDIIYKKVLYNMSESIMNEFVKMHKII